MKVKLLLMVFVLFMSIFSYPWNSHAVSVVNDIAVQNSYDTTYGHCINTTGPGSNGAWHYIWYAPSGTYISGFSVGGTQYLNQRVATQTGLVYLTSGGTVTGINGGSYIDFGNNGTSCKYYNVHVFITSDVADQATVQAAKDSADTAATNASNAYNAANTAATNASTAATQSTTAASKSTQAVNQTWYTGTYGGNSESAADLAGYIRMLRH